jgi:hypothetical protein
MQVSTLSGLALLNNLESGLPSLLALIFTLLLLYRSISNFTRAVLSILTGVFLVFGFYSLLVLSTGRALHFSYMIAPLKIVVSGGFFQVPMAVGGYHNIFAIFFASGMAMSTFLFFRAQKIGSVSLKRVAALMSFSSSWGLVGMVYFSGRSFTSTLLAGSTYALGLLAVATNTHFLLPLICGVNVIEAGSVAIQMAVFKASGRTRRFFRMTPIHHHFELIGWPETTVIIRFWIIGGVCVAASLALFIGDFTRISDALR